MATRKATRKQWKDVGTLNFKAALTEAEMQELERFAQNKNHGVNRRIGLAVLVRSKRELLARMEDPAESAQTYLDMQTCIRGYIDHLKGVLGMMEAAEARTFVMMEHINQKHPGLVLPGTRF